MRKIRIVHVLSVFDLAGTETMLMNIYKNIDERMFEFYFIVHGEKKGYYEKHIKNNKHVIYRVPRFTGINLFKYIKSFEKIYEDISPDIVHGHIGSTASIYLGIAKSRNIKTIAHSHNTYRNQINFKQLIYKALSYPTRYIGDEFFACSVQAGLDRYGREIVNSQKFSIIPNSLNPNKYKYNDMYRDAIRRKYNIGNEKIVIGHIGRFSEQKNHKKIISVFIELLKINPNYHLFLIGDGETKNEVKSRIEKENILKNITILPSQSEIWKYYSAFDLFFFPSLYEGFGMVLIEAQYNGLTCVVSESIVEEVCITNNFKKVELNRESHEWAKIINNSVKARSENLDILDETYDINYSINKLEGVYRRIFNEQSS